MKKIMILAMFFLSLNAPAADGGSSWDEIYAAGLWAQWPQVNFGVEESGDAVFVSIDNVCVVGDNMMATRTPVEVCLKYGVARGTEQSCISSEKRILTTARRMKATMPGGEGLPDVSYDFEYALSYEIPVGYNHAGNFMQRFTKAHTISYCAD